MYERHFGLREKPFSLLPDPRFFYAGPTHRMALSLLEYGLGEQTGFVVLTGEAGSGKTTVLNHLLGLAGQETTLGLVSNTHSAFGELMRWVLHAFGLDGRGKDGLEQHAVLTDFLRARHAVGRRAVLAVDEAQNLGPDGLEQLRMLSNINGGADHLLQLVLVGQPTLRTLLRRAELRPFTQRIAVDHDLAPLDRATAAAYLRHRLALAGGAPDLFDETACHAIQWLAHGLPRPINALADLALVHAFADGLTRVGIATVIEAARARADGGLAAFRGLDETDTAETVAQQMQEAVPETHPG